jgi:formylmethanofuran dehydrogenase subunit E
MIKKLLYLGLLPAVITLSATALRAHDDDHLATPGANAWNQSQEPTNWWNQIKQEHGHVGPWNVLGWRVGKAALRELNATWGRHELDIVTYVPIRTPFSCLADGLVVGTGNSIGRLDIRLAEVQTWADVHVSIRRKDGTGPVLLFKPDPNYLQQIQSKPEEALEALAHESGDIAESKLFTFTKLPQAAAEKEH